MEILQNAQPPVVQTATYDDDDADDEGGGAQYKRKLAILRVPLVRQVGTFHLNS